MLLINNLIKELDRPNGLILGLFYDTVDVTVNRMQFRPTKGCFISTECTDLPFEGTAESDPKCALKTFLQSDASSHIERSVLFS